MTSWSDILDFVLTDNATLLNEKYLILYVLDGDELRSTCYGVVDLSIGPNNQKAVSVSSESSELLSDSNEDSVRDNL
ncbi:LEF-10 [Plodia interpunctella granulovirus]|uniref:LEF-10 n=1 Tax=Plodia interpunctella granulovirus TaxID=262175 RepID=A0A1L5JGT2_9BBAC|nr:LEF-10 [Plodia interpunctella granulovirus]APO14004.1 LEF-10 [Plodia interpunctella granulovirus]